jgi:hypothetical protein
METMHTHLVQIADSTKRRVALVVEPHLQCLTGVSSIYELAQHCLRNSLGMAEHARSLATGERFVYDEVYGGHSPWQLLSPIDVPSAPSKVLVAGTGLTHLGSARQRQAMHLANENNQDETKDVEVVTDSMRMFQWGVEGGRPAAGEIGIAPEWFYKGDASALRATSQPLEIPFHAEDGGEEAELAGVYIISDDGTPYLIGMTQGNEFSDHKFEKRNYLNLAGSKLRVCSLGPELVLDADFSNVAGRVTIMRDDVMLWQRPIASGEDNMCHSLANLEHHHFKFAGHRQPGNVHVHFFGADTLSFGAGIVLKEGDVAEVSFEGYGRPLRNPIAEETRSSNPVRVRSLA